MKSKNGFFSMSIIYAFFLVFAMLAAVLLANYTHNRLLIREYNNEIKADLDTRGNNKLARLVNLLRNSSFEIGEILGTTSIANHWILTGTAKVDSNQRYDGIKSVKFAGSGINHFNKLEQKLDGITIKKNHVYYVQFRIFTAAGEEVTYTESKIYLKDNNNSTQYEFDNGSLYNSPLNNPYPNLTPPSNYTCGNDHPNDRSTYTKCYKSTHWEYIVGVVNRQTIDRDITNASFVIEQTNTKYADIFIDCVMLIDLTESYGEGNEPVDEYGNPTWLNTNISYFRDKYIHNKSEIVS